PCGKSHRWRSGPPARCPGQSRSARHPGRKERRSAASPGERCPPHRPGQGHRRRRTPLPRTPPPDRRRPLRLRLPAFWLRPAAWGAPKAADLPGLSGPGPGGRRADPPAPSSAAWRRP
ncbi:50S ribosomal protein L20, partial [Dysosmobacter welbionis]